MAATERDAASPDDETDGGQTPGQGGQSPDGVVYRRRREDWLSDPEIAAGADPGEPHWHARRAAIELAKATVIARDGLTGDHSDDVGLLADAIAEQLGLDRRKRANVIAAAQLHDIGKVAVPEPILQKPGPLDSREWAVVRRHAPVGAQMLESVPELREVARIVRHSHEHWDGSGYPDGLAGDQIPLASRVVLCADAFHAMRSDRPYHPGRLAAEALGEIRAYAGIQFDPEVVAALERVIAGVRSAPAARFRGGTAAALGSRRLAALLLVLALAGGAFAALRSDLSEEEGAAASVPRPRCERADCPALAPLLSFRAFPAPTAESRRGRSRAPEANGSAQRPHSRRRPRGSGQRVTGARARRPPSAVLRPRPRPRSNGLGARHSGNAYAYGHQRRLLNPHPPKLPPGRLKPKRAP